MTTEIKISFTDDITIKNDTFNIPKDDVPIGVVLASFSWLAKGTNRTEIQEIIFQKIYKTIIEKLPGLNIWLLIGNSSWQPDNRIIRYRKLWGMMDASGLKIFDSDKCFEHCIESSGKLKYFGAKLLNYCDIKSAIDMMHFESNSYILVTSPNDSVQDLLSYGWNGISYKIDPNFIGYISSNKALLLKLWGYFDDIENGVIGIGVPDMIKHFKV